MLVNTVRLLKRVQAAYRTQDQSLHDAADSCLSYLILHLRTDTIRLPKILVPLYTKLPEVP